MKPLGLLLWTLCTACLFVTAAARGQSYVFTTIAGTPGRSGAVDGTNGAALFNNPAGLAIDPQGNLYVSEDLSHTIRKLTPVGNDWVVTTIAGMSGTSGSTDGTNNQARFNRPRGMAADASGALFVADYFNSTIRKVEPVGNDWLVTTIAGSPGVLDCEDGSHTNALFRRPTGIAASPAGALFVADMNNHVIRQMEYFEPEWYTSTIAGFPFVGGSADGVGMAAEFATPYSLVVVKGGTLYVADTGNNAVRQVRLGDEGWTVTTIAGNLGGPSGSSDGVGANALFRFPAGITANASGNLFVSDQDNHTIRMLTRKDAEWEVVTIGGTPMTAGTNDGVGAAARFQKPWGIVADVAGNIYVADLRNHTIRKGSPSAAPGPRLSVRVGPETLTLSWPLSATGYVLESSPTLDPPSSWTASTDLVVQGPDAFEVTVGTGTSAAFFRLRKP